MQPITLPPKFKPFTLDKDCSNETEKRLFERLQRIFNNAIDSDPLAERNGFKLLAGKAHIVEHADLPGWIIKCERHDYCAGCTLPDTHIYRVRRAEKLRSLQPKEFIIPKKYVYQHGNKWYVIAQKLDLHPTKSLRAANNEDRVNLTPSQAEECTLLIYKGKLEDVGAHNIAVTTDGKLALIDTEPFCREAMKVYTNSIMRFLPLVKENLLLARAQINSERLNDLVRDNSVECKIRHVQNSMLLRYLVKATVVVGLPILVMNSFSHGRIATKALVVAGKTLAYANAGFGSLIAIRLVIDHFYHRTDGAYFRRAMKQY